MSDLLHALELSWSHIYFLVISSTNTFWFRVFLAGFSVTSGGKSDDTQLLD
jgi:hypothetical protein